MGKTSRDKGKRGERELARRLREYGYDCRRGQQFCGANGDADVVGLPGVHIEVKRTEALRLYDALDQAKADAREGELPVVMHRKNNCEWIVVAPFAGFMEMCEKAEMYKRLHVRTSQAEKLHLYDVLSSVKAEAKEGKLPAIFHANPKREWVVILPLEGFMEIFGEYDAGKVIGNERG